MDQTATRQAQRLTDAFNHFNRVSEQLSSSYQLLERHLAEITRRFAAGTAAAPTLAGERAYSAPHLQAVLDALPAGVVVLDGDGRVAECNRVAIDLLGEPLAGALWFEVIRRAFAAQCRLGDLRLTDGRLVALATNPLADGPGQVILINEVTDSRAMQALVQRQQRLASMGEMAAALAHQIRTPLAASLLYVSQLEARGPTSPGQRRGIEKIRACLDHLDQLVRDMLMFARDGAFSTETFAATVLIDAFRRMSEPLARAGGCRLEIVDDSGAARLRGNPDALVAVLQNLLENAIQACRGDESTARRGGGHLGFVARRVAGMDSIEFLLEDDGPGMEPAVRERVLEPFFTTKSRGTGLGLAVAQAVVHAHGGVLWIESEPGHGTTVGVRLPLAADPS
ncbi:MAG: PAS domain-containing protein [Gammaproteobacteria bacterium]|nr:PAS domain-containing protein [Gammaproteobacteria bacterium]